MAAEGAPHILFAKARGCGQQRRSGGVRPDAYARQAAEQMENDVSRPQPLSSASADTNLENRRRAGSGLPVPTL